MTDRPIIFSAPMVRALLDGRKTQTRRVLKPVKGTTTDDFVPGEPHSSGLGTWMILPRDKLREPNFAIGDRLWVREAWTYINHQRGPFGLEICIGYNADGESLPNRPFIRVGNEWEDRADRWPWIRRKHSPLHMPRWASRLTLIVTDVRVERLQDISDDDARAEGFARPFVTLPDPMTGERADWPAFISPREAFSRLWQSIHGPGSWEANPWVAVIAFETHRCNIDALGEPRPRRDHQRRRAA